MKARTASPYHTAAHQESRDRKILTWDEDILYRFWDRYTEPDANDCETWLGKPDNGYGRFRADGQIFNAHRAAAILRVGADSYAYQASTLHDAELIQAGLCVGKLCGVHIKLGSQAENGQAPDSAKLDWPRVEAIRARYAAGGVTYRELADEYGVSNQTVSDIINNKMWKESK
jgi:hypothetical protein